MRKYRTHYQLMWKKEPDYCRTMKGFPEPGTCNPDNQHHGVMPAMHDEFSLSGRQAGILLEKLGRSGISYEQLKGVSATLSYLYSLKTGKEEQNWEDVKEAMGSFLPKDFGKSKTNVPKVIPTAEKLKVAFTTGWTCDNGMSFSYWLTGLLACWCWSLWGCRSNCDLDSLKKSEVHTISEHEGWASTAYLTGRNKLPGKKKGTRPWNTFFVCMCPNGVHQPVPDGWQWCIQPDGNPSRPPKFCTECPINCLVLKARFAGPRPMHLFSKWTKTAQTWASNHGDVVKCAQDFLRAQGCGIEGDYDRNAGRRACAACLDATGAIFQVGFEHHGDNPDIWIKHYQPSLEWVEFARRVQSKDPRIATRGLRMWKHYCERDRTPQVPTHFESFGTRLMVKWFQEQGKGYVVEECLREHERQEQLMGGV